METKLYPQGAQLRCHVCGSPAVTVLCHHCGRPMCKRHGPVKPLLSWITENREFNRLTLGNWPLNQHNGAHCDACVHSSPNYRRLVIAPSIIILLIGLVLIVAAARELGDCLTRLPPEYQPGIPGLAEVLRDPQAYSGLQTGLCYRPELTRSALQFARSALVCLFGLSGAIAGLYLNRERIAADLAQWQPPVPLGPVSDNLVVHEYFFSVLGIDKTGHSTHRLSSKPYGKITPNLRFIPPDRQRLEDYRSKYGFGQDRSLPFHAGHLVLSGRPHIEFTTKKGVDTLRPNLLWLNGLTQEHPYLSAAQGKRDTSWDICWQYDIPLSDGQPRQSLDDWEQVPIRLVPLLNEMENAGLLQMEMHFNPVDFPRLANLHPTQAEEDSPLSPDQVIMIEELRFEISNKMGCPQTDGIVTRDETKDAFLVEWRNLWFPASKYLTSLKLPEMRFEQPVKPGDSLNGFLRLRVPDLRSGMSTLRYFNALGYPVNDHDDPRHELPCKGFTIIEVEFELALSSLPRVRRVILPGNGGQPLSYPGAPDIERLRGLIDALSMVDTGLSSDSPTRYLRRVTQDPPRISGQNVDHERWQWDLSGRRYKGTLPVDFHIVIFGEGKGTTGNTLVEFTVQGFENFEGQWKPLDKPGNFPAHILETHDEIHDILNTKLIPKNGQAVAAGER